VPQRTAAWRLKPVLAVLEAATVLVLRAHYTMDVFATALAAFFAYSLGATVAPAVDTGLRRASDRAGKR
jgi:hypothetical protein